MATFEFIIVESKGAVGVTACHFPLTLDELIEALVGEHQGTLVRPRGEGDSLCVIAGRDRDHAATFFFVAERLDLVGGAARLEGSRPLQVLALEKDFAATSLIE